MTRTIRPIPSASIFLALLVALTAPVAAGTALAPPNDAGEYRYIVELEGPGLLQVQQRGPGERFDPDAPEVESHRETLRAQHLAFL